MGERMDRVKEWLLAHRKRVGGTAAAVVAVAALVAGAVLATDGREGTGKVAGKGTGTHAYVRDVSLEADADVEARKDGKDSGSGGPGREEKKAGTETAKVSKQAKADKKAEADKQAEVDGPDKQAGTAKQPKAGKDNAPSKGGSQPAQKPDAPSAQKPDVPSMQKPNTPSVQKPDTPSAQKPDAPSTQKPDVPSMQKPNTPSVQKPDAPSTQQKPDAPQHTHQWVEKTHVVHHDAVGHNEQYQVAAAYDETVTEEVYDPWACCNVCGADCTADSSEHMYAHAIAGEGGGYHLEYYKTVEKTVHHDAVYGSRWVEDTPAWDETVSDGYVCTTCGATK